VPSRSRLIWINGPFGGGKSSAAKVLVTRLAGAVLFDPEHVGFLLREILPVPTGDFQDLPEWRDLWVRTASTLIDHGSDIVVMPMAVHRQGSFEEVINGLRETGASVHHIVLDASEATLHRRIDQDATESRHAKEWRAAKISQFIDARGWLLPAADLTITTDDLPIDRVAARIAQLLAAR
jgi:hypothetical protein